MTHTTAEMAIRLKAAGWPQPMPKWGQYWAVPNREEMRIALYQSNGNLVGLGFNMAPPPYIQVWRGFAYCPSVIELMQALADLNADPQLEMHKGLFFARFETLDDLQCQSGHNAADLFGELWLKIKTT